jgi:hypothetical protein
MLLKRGLGVSPSLALARARRLGEKGKATFSSQP